MTKQNPSKEMGEPEGTFCSSGDAHTILTLLGFGIHCRFL